MTAEGKLRRYPVGRQRQNSEHYWGSWPQRAIEPKMIEFISNNFYLFSKVRKMLIVIG